MAVLKIHNLNIHRLFNEIGIHMKMLKDFSFWIETVGLCSQQMKNIIDSFQTIDYWLTMHIECQPDIFTSTGKNEIVNKLAFQILKQGSS